MADTVDCNAILPSPCDPVVCLDVPTPQTTINDSLHALIPQSPLLPHVPHSKNKDLTTLDCGHETPSTEECLNGIDSETLPASFIVAVSSQQQPDPKTPIPKEVSNIEYPDVALVDATTDKTLSVPSPTKESSTISNLLFSEEIEKEQPLSQEQLSAAGEGNVSPVKEHAVSKSQPEIPTPTLAENHRLRAHRYQRISFLDAIQKYAEKLQPVDCVIMVERCRPFSKKTKFMIFLEQYLLKILSDLNGGCPLETDFGRDSYTSLYSLHTFDWRNPNPPTTLVSDTPIIKEILTGLDTLTPFDAPPVPSSGEGIPVAPLISAALQQFEAFDRIRRSALGGRILRRRHLILVALSNCQDLAPLEAEEEEEDEEEGTNGPTSCKKPPGTLARRGVLAQLRELRVALSVFSPSPSNHMNLRLLAMRVNMRKPAVIGDLEWPTVVLSREFADNEGSQASHAQRQLNTSAPRRVMAQPQQQQPSSPQQRFQLQQQQLMGTHVPVPSPRLPHQAPLGAHSPQQPRMALVSTYQPSGQPRLVNFSGPNSTETPQMQYSIKPSVGVTGPNSVPDAMNAHQATNLSPMGLNFNMVPTPSMDNQSSSRLVQQQQPQQQQQYYSPMYPPTFENDTTRARLSPAMSSDLYLRTSHSHTSSPIHPLPTDPQASVNLRGSSESLNHDQQKQQQQQQQQTVASPYAMQGVAPSAETGGIAGAGQFQLRQHSSPYQGPQQSPLAANSTSSVGGGHFHNSTTAYSFQEMSRYQSTTSTANSMAPAHVKLGTGLPEDCIVLWDGKVVAHDQLIAHVFILADIKAPRPNLQWHNTDHITLQVKQFERDSQLGQIFIHRLTSYLMPLQLSLAFKSQEQEASFVGRLRPTTASSLPVGIMPPLSPFYGSSTSPPLTTVCFMLQDDGTVVGLVPIKTETFRDDVLQWELRQVQRGLPEKQLPQANFMNKPSSQFDTGIFEMHLQSQASSPFSGSTSSMPNAPGKFVRLPSGIMTSAMTNRSTAPRKRMGAMLMDGSEAPHSPHHQYQQQLRQPLPQPHTQSMWQDQRQACVLPPPGDMTTQQRSFQMIHQPQQQVMMSPIAGSQTPQQNICHPGGMPMGQFPYLQQVQQKLPLGSIGPPPPHRSTPQRQQLHDAPGPFQGSGAVSSIPTDYAIPSCTSAPVAMDDTPVYDQMQQHIPDTANCMRGVTSLQHQRMPGVGSPFPGRNPLPGRDIPRAMRVPVSQHPSALHFMMNRESIMYENQQDQQVTFDPSQAGSVQSQHMF